LTRNLAEFYCVANGNFSDSQQLEKDDGSRTNIYLKMQSVVASALSRLPVLYVEQYNDGVLTRALVHIVTQGNNGVIFLDQYNLTGDSQIKSGSFDIGKIKTLTPRDLHRQQECKAAFERVEPFLFSVNYEVCERAPVDKQRKSYSATFKCNELIVVINRGSPEKPSLVPYQIKLQGYKYPLENAPANYDCKCDNTSD
ncbi:unnamed protein product, partial [Candidula unifasciata]